MDYKETLNLPQTDFPMKANLALKETEILKHWKEIDLYQLIRKQRKGKSRYLLHDGPPYANGNIHLGTALNKILKDIIVKAKTMQGYDAPYIPGWDCHGLPIEQEVDKKLGGRKKELTISEIRQLCRNYALKYTQIQKEEFKRLGVFADWDNPYLTLTPHYVATIVREMGRFIENGALYRGLKPIHWCPHCRTALAEAEIEYKDHLSPSIYVKCYLDLPASPPALKNIWAELLSAEKIFQAAIIIWTTTPWTLPANLAISLHPEFDYQALIVRKQGGEDKEEIYILAKELAKNCLEIFGLTDYKFLRRFKGKELEGLRYTHPLFPEKSLPVILGEHVTLQQGTGCVHTAPGHGEEDYEIGLKYGLEIYNTVDEGGRFFKEIPSFGGRKVFAANQEITERLNKTGNLVQEGSLTHSYPHCWRCKKPLLFRATAQWFISLEKNNLRTNVLEEISRVKWIPPWGQERIFNMVRERPDWCVSRQRSWGVPLVAFYCQKCRQVAASQKISNFVAELIQKEGSDIWFEKPAEALLPPGIRCSQCGGSIFDKERDILDVWFDSGISHSAVLENNRSLSWPADLYLEGSDQHRGWFQSSLLHSVATRQQAPFKTVLTHGYVVDGKGKKMSKSLGNVISPEQIIREFGVEILRLWVVSENYTEDIRISPEILQRLRDAYRKIRNTFRFCLGNIFDFDPEQEIEYQDLWEIDRFILYRLRRLREKIIKAYDSFSYHIFFHAFYNFCTLELSALYFDIIKDRLYISKRTGRARRAAQTVLYRLVLDLARLMAPVLPFTAEEVWSHLPGKSAQIRPDKSGNYIREQDGCLPVRDTQTGLIHPAFSPNIETPPPELSLHLTEFPRTAEKESEKKLAQRWETILSLRGEVNKALEIARKDKVIGHSLEAKLELSLPEELAEISKENPRLDLKGIFIVSQISSLRDGETLCSQGRPGEGFSFESEKIKGLKISVSRAEGEKCVRCWNYSKKVGKDKEHPLLCERCLSIVAEL